jgi:hypothetical protein
LKRILKKIYLWFPFKIKDDVWLQVFLLKYFKYTRGSQEPVSFTCLKKNQLVLCKNYVLQG